MASWDNQLNSKEHDPKYQNLVEIAPGHGNSESFVHAGFNELMIDMNVHHYREICT